MRKVFCVFYLTTPQKGALYAIVSIGFSTEPHKNSEVGDFPCCIHIFTILKGSEQV